MKEKYFSICLIVLTILSMAGWSSVSIPGNTFINWVVCLVCIFYCFKSAKGVNDRLRTWDRNLLTIYLVWLGFNVVRGIFVAENYWEYKNLIGGTFTLLLPAAVYAFSDPGLLQRLLKPWFRWVLPIFFVFFLWIMSNQAFHFCLGPVFFLGIFLPIIPRKWRLWFLVILGLSLIFFAARSQVIKAALAIMMSVAFYYKRYFSLSLFRVAHWCIYIIPIILLFLGIFGVYNVFQDTNEKHEGEVTATVIRDGKEESEDVSSDTRTFIYEEVISSALLHGYWLWGRTPARGNDSVAFGEFTARDLGTGKYERHKNEVCHPNVFTWLGLIGMLLYCFFYLRSSWLAMFRSRSACMKFVGIFVAFHWAYGWVEDCNAFDITNLSLWMAIAMGLSKQFRAMDDGEFHAWLRGIFSPKAAPSRLRMHTNEINHENSLALDAAGTDGCSSAEE